MTFFYGTPPSSSGQSLITVEKSSAKYFNSGFCAASKFIEAFQEPTINFYTVTLVELSDTVGEEYESPDLCAKTLNLVDQFGVVPQYTYSSGVLIVEETGNFTASFSMLNYPEIQSEPF